MQTATVAPTLLTAEEMARLEAQDPMLAAAYRDGRVIDAGAWMKADAEQEAQPKAASFMTFVPDPSAPMGKRFDSVDLLTCPQCQQPAGYLYRESGVCMSCEVGWIDEDTADEAAAETWEAPDFFDRCDEAYDAWVDAQFATC